MYSFFIHPVPSVRNPHTHTTYRCLSAFLVLALTFFLLLFPAKNSLAQRCADDSEGNEKGVYPFDIDGEEITAKFIFVAFRGGADPADTLVTYDAHQVAADNIMQYITDHSRGNLTFSPNSGLILHPGAVLDEDNLTAESWIAELTSIEYRTGNCNGCVDLPSDYLDTWASRVSYWTSGFGSYGNCGDAAELIAEIFWKIEDEWEPTGSNPFGGAGEATDTVFVIFQTKDFPAAGFYGHARIPLDATYIKNEVPFFSNLRLSSPGKFLGQHSCQTSGTNPPSEFDIQKCAIVAVHEFVHTLGPGDGPPSASGMETNCPLGLCEYAYHYGTQNLMYQYSISGYGIPPIALPVLERMPWYSEYNGDVIDFTGDNLLNEKIYDVRGETGKIYKFSLGLYGDSKEEDFVLAYHSGQGIDAQSGESGGPVTPSQGLEIWHRVGGSVYDLESSIGLWDFGDADLDQYCYPEDCSVTVLPDTINGYDNHDVWKKSDGSHRNQTEYENYRGEYYDFFQIGFTGDDARYNKNEFSFRSNPNCFGYNKDPGSHDFLRRRPQDVPNSLVVRIRDTDNDSGGNYMIVDLLSAPGGVVLAPDGGAYAPGDTIHITWVHDEYADEYDGEAHTVDILFSKFGVDSFPEVLKSDYPVGPGVGSWDWVLTEDHSAEHGWIKVVFNNPFSDYTNSAVNPAEFEISGQVVVAEYLVFPNEGGESLFVGSLAPITWTNYLPGNSSVQIDSVDLAFSSDNGNSWSDPEVGIDYTVDPVTNYNVHSLAIAEDMVTSQGKIRLFFHSDNGIASDESEASFLVYPVEARFVDVSSDVGVSYQGSPNSAITLNYDNLGGADLLISMKDVEGADDPKSVLFKNASTQGGNIVFVDRTYYDFASAEPPPLNSHGLSAGDYDNDGDIDFFITHENDPRLYQNVNGFFHNKTNDSQVMDQTVLDNLNYSQCAVWVDFDHDGDLDLFIGRSEDLDEPNPVAKTDFLLENLGEAGFAEASISSDFRGNNGCTSTAVWSDFDNDGLWEVIIGEFRGLMATTTQTVMFEETPSGSFEENTGGFPSGFNLINVNGISVTDFDRDGDLDFFVNRSNASSEILVNVDGDLSEVVFLNDGSNWKSTISTPLDFNLDGWPDFLLSNPTSDPQLKLIANFMGNPLFPENDFVDVTAGTGLGGFSAPSRSILPCDFNNDGDLDIFLGSIQAGSDPIAWILKSEQQTGANAPVNHWLGIDLVPSEDNTSSLGAVVILEAPGEIPLGAQYIDGGSGFGGQMPRIPVFGLGDYSGSVEGKVLWPLGRETSFTVSSTDLDGVVTVTAGNDLQVLDSTIVRSIEFDPSTMTLDWIITWQTDHWSSGDLDRVTINLFSGQDCGQTGPVVLQAGEPDVVVQTPKYFADEATGLSSFKHQLEWRSQVCHIYCHYGIEVESSNGVITDSGTCGQDVKFKVCFSVQTQGGQ